MPTPLIDSIGRAFDLPDFVVCVLWLGDVATFACSDGSVRAFSGGGEAVWSNDGVHDGALLAACPGFAADLLTTGEDGRIVATDANGGARTLANFKGAWIETIAASSAAKLAAVGLGKDLAIVAADGEKHRFPHESTVQGAAFDAAGRRVAAAHYNGATISWAASPQSRRKTLAWKGSHLSASWSRDGKFLVTTMQENALHGWRLQDGQHFRMAGYPTRIRSASWSNDGKQLITAGATEVVAWPFVGPPGPMGQNAAVAGELGTPCAAVACHPARALVAAGGADGEVALMPLGGGKALLLEAPHGGRVSALAWSGDGRRLAIGCESGRAGVLDFTDAL